MSLEHDRIREGVRSVALPLLLRVDEAARELGVSRRRIYQLVASGQLELRKIGRSSRITGRSILRLALTSENEE